MENRYRLRQVILYLGKQKLAAVVDGPNARRTIDYTWLEKEPGDVPPKKWFEAVIGEIEYRRSEDLKKATGRPTLPTS